MNKNELESRDLQYNRWTGEIIEKVMRPGSNAIDVGAGTGEIMASIVEHAPDGEHIACEAVVEFAEKLRNRFPMVTVCPFAISDAPGEAEFTFVKNAPGYSGLREREYDQLDVELEKRTVRMETIDRLLVEPRPIRLIKIDVEGAELNVLRGARRTIEDSRPFIVFEHGLGAADKYDVTPGQFFDYTSGALGLRISLLDSWMLGEKPLTKEAFEAEFYQERNWCFLAHPEEFN